jgi:hypothetical protein
MKLSLYLNKHYSYSQIKEVNSNSPGEIAIKYTKDFTDRVFQAPDIVLRAIKSETVEALKHYHKLDNEANFYVLELDKIIAKGPHLGEKNLEIARELEEKRDILLEFVYSVEAGLGYILEFLLGHYSRTQIGFPFLKIFKDFLPRNHYLKRLLETENEAIWNLNEELLLINDIVGKLDYWERKYYYHFTALQKFVNSDGTATQIRKSPYAKSNLKEIIFNEFNCDELSSPAMIPSTVYQIHFKDGLQNSKFTYWFLKFNAKLWAEEYYIPKFYEKENSPIAIEFAESELRELTALEEKATEKLLRKEIGIYSTPESNSQNYFLELKRIESNYYHTRVLDHPHMMGGDSTVNIFAKHIFFKHYLKDVIDKFNSITIIPEKLNEIFISYSHKDIDWLDRLMIHLNPLIRNEKISVWNDKYIQPGSNWKEELKEIIAQSRIAILLVSPNFLASDFIMNEELPQILKNTANGQTIIYWIAISHSSYKETPLKDIQSANDPSKPLSSLSPHEQDKELVRIANILSENKNGR